MVSASFSTKDGGNADAELRTVDHELRSLGKSSNREKVSMAMKSYHHHHLHQFAFIIPRVVEEVGKVPMHVNSFLLFSLHPVIEEAPHLPALK